jgi:hypothetical protein
MLSTAGDAALSEPLKLCKINGWEIEKFKEAFGIP